jgi:hypothetical protein
MDEITGDSPNVSGIWMRGLYMLLFMFFYSVAEFVLGAVVVVQFGYRLFTGENHPRLLALGAAIASYIYQVLRFLSFNTEVMPYPFSEWPQGEPAEEG